MRQDKINQIIVINEADPALFEERMNEALSHIADPEIKIFEVPYTAIITYRVSRSVPESVLELLEMVDGEDHQCSECPRFMEPTDKRRKWGSCTVTALKTKADCRACEHFYLLRYRMLSEAAEAYKEIPYTTE